MSSDETQFRYGEYLRTWYWECPEHRRVEMFMTNPPLCGVCKKRCVQVSRVVATFQPSSDRNRPWLVYVDGKRMSTASGVGRRFATKEAAESAGRAELEAGTDVHTRGDDDV